ncbi:HAMP domain-containing sensor histidine kinase [Petroclostridium sp. X23]|uniref:HAMP domain-containing sensor histidine kinase n=1 Tax=Petroclostridium sp. X23 TaxID=3045146 RepID=UPI0024AC9BFB|nr:HAMP domain-containing sensor histidine kinase [Petroclostridium sp. X23]WHH56914.1 HAMP domain-containing sensor histidine kinase [Petroclostridium sp. X23]
MKLKWWLIMSHIIVMLAPVIIGAFLFSFILNYNKKTELNDYITAVTRFKEYEEKLTNPQYYLNNSFGDKQLVPEEKKESVQIDLYNSKGQQFYSSRGNDFMYINSLEMIYSDLYRIDRGYRAYVLKKPVFYENKLVGIYKITLARESFVKEANDRTILAMISFGVVNLAVFVIIVILLNRKFNKPIKYFVEGMHRFAEGEDSDILYTGKDEIGEIIKQFNLMKDEIKEKNAIIEQQQKNKEYMISAISHDLKTPLTAIRAYTEALREERKGDTSRGKISIILSKCDYMKKMIEDLMMYNLLTTDYKTEFVLADGSELIDMLFSGYEESCGQRGVNLKVFADVAGQYNVDITQITRVIDNLMSNALEFTPENGNIEMIAVSAGKEFPSCITLEFIEEFKHWQKKGCIVLIKNEGKGIPKEEFNQIFVPFYQIDSSRSKGLKSGVGLGLSIVNLIIERHSGQVKVFSEENWTVFAFWIPEVKKE